MITNISNKPICLIQSPCFTRSGYGDWSLDLVKSILRYDKWNVKLHPTRWGGTPNKYTIEDLLADPDYKELVPYVLREPLKKQPDLFIQITIPSEFNPVGKYNIGITAGIETTTPAGEWIDGLNRMNMNIVMSKFNKDVFMATQYIKNHPDGRKEPLKVEKPMEICHWGVDTTTFKKTTDKDDELEKIFATIKEDFCFLFVGQWTHNSAYGDRKDIGNLIKTFCKTFQNQDNKPALILKTSGVNYSAPDRYHTIDKIQKIRKECGENIPEVYLIHGELSRNQMNCLMNHEKVKAHVSFTHGEGFGHPLLQAAVSGKPVIAPKWSGHMDFLPEGQATHFKGELKPVSPESVNQWIIKEASWFHVDYDAAANLFKKIRNGELDLTEKYDKLRQVCEKDFSISAMDKKLHDILAKNVPEFAVEKPIVLPKLKKLTPVSTVPV